jgi:alanine racemase
VTPRHAAGTADLDQVPEVGAATAEAVVDLSAIRHNVATIAGRTRADVMAVVKADGFGHGLVPVARAALSAGATWLGVTTADEALELRSAGLDVPMLTWLHRPDEDYAPLIDAGVDISAASVAHLHGIASSTTSRRPQVHLKVDTGMSRNGAVPDEWPNVVAVAHDLERAGLLHIRGIWTHLATADEPWRPDSARQLAAFDDALKIADDAGISPDVRHVANSAGALAVPESHYDLVRVGIGCYGVEPVLGHTYGLRPAMTLRARAILVKRVPGGTGVSYGLDYTTPDETTLVLAPIGYADGVPRNAATTAEVWMHGRRHRIAGRVSMDQFVIDAGDTPVEMGDEIVLFGPGDHGEPTVNEWASWAGTNAHEILTRVGPRVPRRYVSDDLGTVGRTNGSINGFASGRPGLPAPRRLSTKEQLDG